MFQRTAAVLCALLLSVSFAAAQNVFVHTLLTPGLQSTGQQVQISISADGQDVTAAPVTPAPAGQGFGLTGTLIGTGSTSGYATGTYDCTLVTDGPEGPVTTRVFMTFGINVLLSPSSWSQIYIPGTPPTIVAYTF